MVSFSYWAAAAAEVTSCVEAWNCDVESALPSRKVPRGFVEEVLLGMNNTGAEPNLERARRVSTAVRLFTSILYSSIKIMFGL
ncbi:unnamed protein product, partial [Musa hybrid cultivar]